MKKNKFSIILLFVLFMIFYNKHTYCQSSACDERLVNIKVIDYNDSVKLGFAILKLYNFNRTVEEIYANIDGEFQFYRDSVAFVKISYAAVYSIFLNTSDLHKENVVYMITCDELLKTGYVKHDRNMIKLAKMINRFSEKWLNNKKNMDKEFRKIDDFYNRRIAKPIAK